MGARSNVIVRLCREGQIHINHEVLVYNYYTTMQTIAYLAKRGIWPLETVRRNRISTCKLSLDNSVKGNLDAIVKNLLLFIWILKHLR